MSLTEMTLSGGVLILLIAAVRGLALHRLPKAVFPALWTVAALRLLLPVEFGIPLPAALPAPAPQGAAVWAAGQAAVPGDLAALPAAMPAAVDWTAVFALVWLAGAVLAAGYFAGLYFRSMEKFKTSLPANTPFLRDWVRAQRLVRPLEVRRSDRVAAPLTYGIFRPVILLPKGLEERDEETLVRVLTHELVHIRRFDGAAKLLFAAALCVHWFNPLVWALYVLANRDLELSCDERVLRLLGGEERAAYALTLIAMEEDRSPGLSFFNHFSRFAIEERIEAIMKYEKKSVIAAVLAAVLIVGATTAFASAAPVGDGNVETVWDDVLLRSDGGEKQYSVDGGKTWLSEERYQAQYGSWGDGWQVEWWTAETYAQWLEQEKENLRDVIGSQGWTPSTGWFTWDEKRVEEAVARYEEILEEIKNGALYSRRVLDRDGREVPDVALGSDAPLGTVVTTVFDDGRSTVLPEEAVDSAALLRELAAFGVGGSEREGLTYRGQAVRTLVDGVSMENGYSVRYIYQNDTGTADIHTVRSVRYNPDGSYDPMGELIAVVSKGEQGFDQGLIDSCGISGEGQESGTAETWADLPDTGERSSGEATIAAVAGGGEEGTPLPGMFDKYAPYGLTYRETETAEGMQRNLFYNGKPVNHFADVTPDGGVFTFGSSEQTPDGLTVRAVYGERGELTGLTAERSESRKTNV